jgi:hypothetical protein
MTDTDLFYLHYRPNYPRNDHFLFRRLHLASVYRAVELRQHGTFCKVLPLAKMTYFSATFRDASRETPTFYYSDVELSKPWNEVNTVDRPDDMADPFEVRLYFSNRLRALNPCEDNIDEVATFALKHRDLDEDLHSCILEQLESVGFKMLLLLMIANFLPG